MNNIINWKINSVGFENDCTEIYFTAELTGHPKSKNKVNDEFDIATVYEELYTALDTQYTIKNVIFNDPATIILWGDGTKSVVKVQDGDTYDKEKGFVMAYLKKVLGNDNTFNKIINKWVK